MKHYTFKELKQKIAEGAYDISYSKEEDLPYSKMECVGYSTGIYGINGALFQTKDGTEFVVIGRTTNLFKLF